jgi:tricarballylate dehydrogenase
MPTLPCSWFLVARGTVNVLLHTLPGRSRLYTAFPVVLPDRAFLLVRRRRNERVWSISHCDECLGVSVFRELQSEVRPMQRYAYDVVVVGAGNAALCAALSAQEQGADVLVLERAPQHARGGNSYFAGGLVRFAYGGLDDIRALIPDLTKEELESLDVGSYSAEEYYEDIARVTEYLADPELVSILVSESYSTMMWLRENGVRLTLALGRQAFKSGDKFRFWGGVPAEFIGGGVGLVDMLFEAARTRGIDVWYSARGRSLVVDESGTVTGIRVGREGVDVTVDARAVVLACGGFEANPEMRAKYLGPNWDTVKVRGTEYNTGDGIVMALGIDAQPYGHWSGCHAVAWDMNAPPTGDRKVGESYQKHSYPLGIVVNRRGERFVDEGADFRNYTYAKYGQEIMRQPGGVAYQIFDSKVLHMLRDEYRIPQVTKVTANTLEELADGCQISRDVLVRTVCKFNAAVNDRPFDPTVLDGKGTVGLVPPKSNWAQPIDTPPYAAFGVVCGITFTFGGLRIDSDANVLDGDGRPVPGVHAAGELVGGLFYHNYPGGTGLSSGAVFGRIAGRSAAKAAQRQQVAW